LPVIISSKSGVNPAHQFGGSSFVTCGRPL
jgi:hypothetical protein